VVWSQPLIFPPRPERLGVREHTRPACRSDQLSAARASVLEKTGETPIPVRGAKGVSQQILTKSLSIHTANGWHGRFGLSFP
jgi:hypothetical protein